MSVIILSICLFLVIIAIYLYLKSADKVSQQKEITEWIKSLKGESEINKLHITEVEKLRSVTIGLDKLNRKIYILSRENNISELNNILIDELNQCKVEMIYQTNRFGEIDLNKETSLESIVLRLEFKDNRRRLDLPFFKVADNSFYELPELVRKAERWKSKISNMIVDKSIYLYERRN